MNIDKHFLIPEKSTGKTKPRDSDAKRVFTFENMPENKLLIAYRFTGNDGVDYIRHVAVSIDPAEFDLPYQEFHDRNLNASMITLYLAVEYEKNHGKIG